MRPHTQRPNDPDDREGMAPFRVQAAADLLSLALKLHREQEECEVNSGDRCYWISNCLSFITQELGGTAEDLQEAIKTFQKDF